MPNNWYCSLSIAIEKIFGKGMEQFKEKENEKASDEMKRSIRNLRWDIEPYHVSLTAYVVGFLLLIVSVIIVGVLVIATDLPFYPHLLYILLGALTIPLIIMIFLGNYPKIAASSLRLSALGVMPHTTSYLIMAMRINPSISNAVIFASENSAEPLASSLRKMLWEVYMRKYHSIEEAFLAFAYEWGKWSDDFKRSLYTILSSEFEKTTEGLHRALDKAMDIMLSGTRRIMEKYSASLSGPTFVLFSLGILLPMILAAMLPMAPLGGINISAVHLFLMLNVLFPLATFAYASHILGKKPGAIQPPKINVNVDKMKVCGIALACGIPIILLGTPHIYTRLGDLGNKMGTIPIIWGIAIIISIYCIITSKDAYKKISQVRKMEEEFPDALFQLGSRIGEGVPLETALLKTGDTMKGAEISSLFKRISFILRVTRLSLDDILFGSKGILKNFPSSMIRASMKVVVESVKKDVKVAGHIIVVVSQYLKDLKKVEHDIQVRLGSVLDMMKTTGALFAPILMGITVGLYYILSNVTQKISVSESIAFGLTSSVRETIPSTTFMLVIGIYVLLTVLTISYYTASMKFGKDPIEIKMEIGRNLPIATFVFSIATAVGFMIVPGV